MGAVSEWLSDAGAQHDVVEWAAPYGDDFARLWGDCPRGDWLLAIAARLGCPRRALVQAACACARLCLDYLPEGEARPGEALDLAEAYCRGEVGADGLPGARQALDVAAEVSDPVAGAAASAALSALDAISDPDAAAATVAFACQAALLDAADCGMESALRYTQVESAERVRKLLTAEAMAELFDDR